MQGPGPGPRYGHVMALVGQRYLMVVGGNDGKSLCVILNECSFINECNQQELITLGVL